LVKALLRVGFVGLYQRGSHLHLLHPETGRRTVVPMHGGSLKVGLVHRILKQAGLTVEDLIRLLD
jgi:predicted RNA binding protein YcfA (HicA-like mRNA interferase family)